MGAVAYQLPYPPHVLEGQGPRLQLVPGLPERQRTSPAVYRRRRIVALLVLSVAVVAAWSLATSGVSWAWHQTSEPAPVFVADSVGFNSWTVGPGDTLWGIARKLQPSGDIRPLVTQLSKARDGRPLQLGETISLP